MSNGLVAAALVLLAISGGELRPGAMKSVGPLSGGPTNNPPIGATDTITMDEDVAHVFQESDFGYSDPDSDPLDHVRITQVESDGDLELNGTDVTPGQQVTAAQLAANQLTFVNDPGESGTNYAFFIFDVHDGTEYSPSTYQITMNVTPSAAPSAFVTVDEAEDSPNDGLVLDWRARTRTPARYWYPPERVDTTGWVTIDITCATGTCPSGGQPLDSMPGSCAAVNPADTAGSEDQAAMDCITANVPNERILDVQGATLDVGHGFTFLQNAAGSRRGVILDLNGGRVDVTGAAAADTNAGACDVTMFVSFCRHYPTDAQGIVSGATKGSSVLTINDATAYSAGDWIKVESDEPPGITPSAFSTYEVQAYVQSVDQGLDQITLDRPLRRNYNYANSQVQKKRVWEDVGIWGPGDFRHTDPTTSASGDAWIGFWGASRFEVVGIEGGPKWSGCIQNRHATRGLISANTWRDQTKNDNEPNKSCLVNGYATNDIVNMSNAFDDVETAMHNEHGAAYNYSLLNYGTDVTTTIASIGTARCGRFDFRHGLSEGIGAETNDSHCIHHNPDQIWGQQLDDQASYRLRQRYADEPEQTTASWNDMLWFDCWNASLPVAPNSMVALVHGLHLLASGPGCANDTVHLERNRWRQTYDQNFNVASSLLDQETGSTGAVNATWNDGDVYPSSLIFDEYPCGAVAEGLCEEARDIEWNANTGLGAIGDVYPVTIGDESLYNARKTSAQRRLDQDTCTPYPSC